MEGTAKLAGFFAAHGIWSVSDGGPLIPMLCYETADGERGMDRLVADDLAEAVQLGQEALHNNTRSAVRAALVCDAFLNLDTGRTDALVIEAIAYGPEGGSLTLAVPYRPHDSADGFAVHRPKFIELTGVAESDHEAIGEAFFDGVDSHEEAAAVWNAHLDPSI